MFQSILVFLDIQKVSKDSVSGGFTIMQLAAIDGLHDFVDALLQGINNIQPTLAIFNYLLF